MMDKAALKSAFDQAYDRNIVLIGFMGAGKSTVSHYMKDFLQMQEVETDEMIVEKEGMSIPEIFAKHGEDYFRQSETEVIRSLSEKKHLIISCGGGAVIRSVNVENLKKGGRIVLLTATPETTLERVRDDDNRPLLKGHMNVEYIAALQEKRREIYEQAADIVIATDGKNAEEICCEILTELLK